MIDSQFQQYEQATLSNTVPVENKCTSKIISPIHCKLLDHTGKCDPEGCQSAFSHFTSCRIIILRGSEMSLHQHRLRKLEKRN